MNWLMYICGGILYCIFILLSYTALKDYCDLDVQYDLGFDSIIIICSIGTWIWFCLKVIK